MDCSPPGSSVHGILQTRILEWVATPSSRGSSQPRDQTCVSYISCTGKQVSHRGSPLIMRSTPTPNYESSHEVLLARIKSHLPTRDATALGVFPVMAHITGTVIISVPVCSCPPAGKLLQGRDLIAFTWCHIVGTQ